MFSSLSIFKQHRRLSTIAYCGVAAVCIWVCGAQQFRAQALLSDVASPVSPIVFLPRTIREYWRNPNTPLPSTLRILRARIALTRADRRAAQSDIAVLPPSPDRDQLRARLALGEGWLDDAQRYAQRAGDPQTMHDCITALLARGETIPAYALQKQFIQTLGAHHTDSLARAEAYRQLGIIAQTISTEKTILTKTAQQYWARLALEAYRRARTISPLDGAYILATAYQEINLDMLAQARIDFEQLAHVDPASSEPLVGYGEIALRDGDRTTARAYLLRALAREPHLASAQRLARKLHTR